MQKYFEHYKALYKMWGTAFYLFRSFCYIAKLSFLPKKVSLYQPDAFQDIFFQLQFS